MNLSLRIDLLPKSKLPEPVAPPRKHLSKILFGLHSLPILRGGDPALYLLCMHAHLFSPIYRRIIGLPLLLLR